MVTLKRLPVRALAFHRAHATLASRTTIAALLGTSIALTNAPPQIERHTTRVVEAFPRLDLAACRELVAKNRDTLAAPAAMPVTYFDLKADNRPLWNRYDAPIVAARIRDETQRAIAREKALSEALRDLPKNPVETAPAARSGTRRR
jgi:hypothetical protein